MANQVPALQVTNVTRTFGGLTALRDVTFQVPRGVLMGILGPNGAGKTTLFNVITGVHPATRGQVRFNGTDITRMPPYAICRLGVGRTWQAGRPFENLTVMENVLIGCYFGNQSNRTNRKAAEATAREAAELVGLGKHLHRLARDLNVFERKMLELARNLAANPVLLLLDEILAGLNPRDVEFSLTVIRRIHKERSITIIWIEHIVRALMEASEQILVLHHGELLAAGTPAEVSRDPRVIEAYLGGTHHERE